MGLLIILPVLPNARTRHFRFGQSVRVSAVVGLREAPFCRRRDAGPMYFGGYSAVPAVCLSLLSAAFGCCRLDGLSDHLIRAPVVPPLAADCPGYAVSEMCRIPGWSPRC